MDRFGGQMQKRFNQLKQEWETKIDPFLFMWPDLRIAIPQFIYLIGSVILAFSITRKKRDFNILGACLGISIIIQAYFNYQNYKGQSLVYSVMFGYMIWLTHKNKKLVSLISLLFVAINLQTYFSIKNYFPEFQTSTLLKMQFAHYFSCLVVFVILFFSVDANKEEPKTRNAVSILGYLLLTIFVMFLVFTGWTTWKKNPRQTQKSTTFSFFSSQSYTNIKRL